jgi:hypothetical protein
MLEADAPGVADKLDEPAGVVDARRHDPEDEQPGEGRGTEDEDDERGFHAGFLGSIRARVEPPG